MDTKGVKIAKNVIIGILIILAFLFAISLTGNNPVDFWKALGTQVVMLVITFLVYLSPEYKDNLLGINTRTFLLSILGGAIIGILYLIILSFVPGLAIAIPLLPQAISDGLRFFTVVIVAPIVETFFFLGALLGYIRNYSPSKDKIHLAIFIQAFLFALFHLGAYIVGLYDLPTVSAGFLGFSSNILTFISAFVFGVVMGYIVNLKVFYGLTVAWIVHTVINVFAYSKFAITFSIFGSG